MPVSTLPRTSVLVGLLLAPWCLWAAVASASAAQPYAPSETEPTLYYAQPFEGIPGVLDVSGSPNGDLEIIMENGAGLSITDGFVQPLLNERPAPDANVLRRPDAIRVLDDAGGTLLEVALHTNAYGETCIDWIWSPYAYSAVYLPDLGVTVRGLSKGEAQQLGHAQDAAVVVTSIDDNSPAQSAQVQQGDVVTAITGTSPVTPLRLHDAGRAEATSLWSVVRLDGAPFALRIVRSALDAIP